ncbi:MAG TPA: RNA-binding domain-containing protein [Nitrososphaerales archaeon]|nr:RNA-binding domain-containing protein [Nitrososphaerales archaeon]
MAERPIVPPGPPDSVKVVLRATVSPSEDPGKVLAAMRQVLGNCDYQVAEGAGWITLSSVSSRCLQNLHDQLRDRHVRDSARRLMQASMEGNVLSIRINRQAAAAGVSALCSSAVESPLGPLNLSVETDSPDQLVDWLTAH